MRNRRCLKLLRAVFILPFSAGDPRGRRPDGLVLHDGSISGVVFLIEVVAILSIMLLVGSLGTDSTLLFFLTMEILAGLAIVICILLFINAAIRPYILTLNDHWDRSSKLMMKFLWLFTIADLSYSAIYLSYHVDCYIHSYPLERIINRILADCLIFTFRLVQTGFLTHFSQRRFVRKLRFYYGLLFLFLINISVIVIDFAESARDVNDYSINQTHVETFSCKTNSSISPFLYAVKNYLEPAGLEYSLLAILFIAQLWPQESEDTHTNRSGSSFTLYDTIDNEENITENSQLLDTHSVTLYESPHRRMRIFTNITISVLVSMPSIVLLMLKIHTRNRIHIDEALNICNSIQATILLIVLVKCFYHMQSDCHPVNHKTRFTSKEYLILTSFVGTLTCYMLQLIPSIILLKTDNQNIPKIYTYVITVFSTYLQTVFILQMKSYVKNETSNKEQPLQYTCMFLSILNFMIWAEDSFLAAQWVFITDAPTIFFGKMVWATYFTFIFPFVIFYRFKCFIAFYGLYYKLRSD